MDYDKKSSKTLGVVDRFLKDKTLFIDNLFADIWNSLSIHHCLKKSGFKKHCGASVTEVVFLILLWKWLNTKSISMFCDKSSSVFSDCKKDTLYDFLKREDINWRQFNLTVAKSIYTKKDLKHCKSRVLVFDDSIKARRGKAMEGVSSHFDHLTHRHTMGQQVLTMGMATESAFLPIDSQIYVSDKKAQPLRKPFKDGRSIASQRYLEATQKTKPEMAHAMLKRAKQHGFKADYVAADAWFGTKPMIRTILEVDMHALLRMKKNKMKYRIHGFEELSADELYQKYVKGQWKKVQGGLFKSVSLEAEINLAETVSDAPRWQSVKLFFMKGINEPNKKEVGKKSWSIFLTTNMALSTVLMVELYALRWSIEVYFKEAKQHLGFLQEQTWTFTSHIASIHLCAVRYLMLMSARLEDDDRRVCDIRSDISDQLTFISVGRQAWEMFRYLIVSSLNQRKKTLTALTEDIIQELDHQIQCFFEKSLSLETFMPNHQ